MSEKNKTEVTDSINNFINDIVKEDLKGNLSSIRTRFPPEPSGYLHIGHAKAFCISFGLADHYGGKYNLRFDDTNPAKEETEYVDSIMEDIKWLGFDWEDRLFFVSDYFEQLYDYAVLLIEKGKAYVCELSADEIREYRGTLNEPGKNSPYRDRPIEENLDLFKRMRDGEFEDGQMTLRAKIDMSSPNVNMRDPVMYRIARLTHHRTGNDWLIYPMYDFAHPLGDAIEGITHSICTLEFENNRPLYNWFVDEIGFEKKPRQVEFAKLLLTDTIMGKRHIKRLIDEGKASGWDDPRLVTLRGLRRRGFTPEIIKDFLGRIGVSKVDSVVDYGFLEYCAREHLMPRAKGLMAVLDPLKVVITNYPEGEEELLEIENNPKNEEMGNRTVPFSREIYIEREDFMEEPEKKFFRLFPGNEVRLKGAYFIKCNDVIKDENGNIIEIHCTYDPETKSGSGFKGRKVKSTIHWVDGKNPVKIEARIYDHIVFDDEESETGYRYNPDSLEIYANALGEPSIKDITEEDRVQFIRKGFYCLDTVLSTPDKPVFNNIVSLKSSYRPKK